MAGSGLWTPTRVESTTIATTVAAAPEVEQMWAAASCASMLPWALETTPSRYPRRRSSPRTWAAPGTSTYGAWRNTAAIDVSNSSSGSEMFSARASEAFTAGQSIRSTGWD
jgi:hypothetical protein